MMTSIVRSPGCYSENLNKRRLLSPDSYRNKKRCRGGVDSSSSGSDGAEMEEKRFSQRQLDYLEQVKQAEIARIRTEYEQFIMKQEQESHNLKQELFHTRQRCEAQEKDLDRMQSENKLLKRAVAIQNQQKEECVQENLALKQLASQAADHIKRLEQSNYALRVHLQTSTASSLDHSHPPDVC